METTRILSPNEFRRRAFREQAMRVLAAASGRGERLTRAQLIERTLACRPPGYFTDFTYAACRLHGMMRAKTLPAPGRSPRTDEWLELLAAVRHEMDTRGLRFTKALGFVLNFRRPSRWHISHKHAEILLRELLSVRHYVVRS